MRIKKLTAVVLSAVLIGALLLSSCQDRIYITKDRSKVQILCAGYAQYDWVSNIIRGSEGAQVTALYKSGVDIHSFQASARDIIAIADSHMFVYTGGGSEESLDKVIRTSAKEDLVRFDCMERLGSRVLGEDQETVPHNGHWGHRHHTDEDADEHIWLSVKNAQILCGQLAEEISALDPKNAQLYRDNAKEYADRLASLDREYEAVTEGAEHRALVFADRFPFRYLAEDYGLECYSAFHGCSSETDAGFSTVLALAEKIDELGLSYVIIIDRGENSIEKAVIEASSKENLQVLAMKSLQTVTDKEIAEGLTYLKAMEENLQVLGKALK